MSTIIRTTFLLIPVFYFEIFSRTSATCIRICNCHLMKDGFVEIDLNKAKIWETSEIQAIGYCGQAVTFCCAIDFLTIMMLYSG